MTLTAPVHVLKGKAKALKRSEGLTMTAALDKVAQSEGYNSWSLLQSKVTAFAPSTPAEILEGLYPGDLLLIGARPGLGKTMLTLQVLLQAIARGRQCHFFSFEYTQKSCVARLQELDAAYKPADPLLRLDFSDDISAAHIMNATQGLLPEGAIIAIDYLQLLDQQRHKPPLQKQVEDLKKFARDKKCIVIFISQIDRAADAAGRDKPGLQDVRLPNPLDLGLFNKSVFVGDGQIYSA